MEVLNRMEATNFLDVNLTMSEEENSGGEQIKMDKTEMGSQVEERKEFAWKDESSPHDDVSPRCVLEIPIVGTDFDSSSSSSSSSMISSPTPDKSFSQGTQWKTAFDVLKKKSLRTFATIPLLAASYEISRKNLRRKLARIRSAEVGIDLGDIPITKPSWRNFSHAELSSATNNFSPENKVGKGGNAEVYKGFLSDGQEVAIKRLMLTDKEDADRTGDFLSELGIVAHINHPHAARLIGYGVEGGLHLVLQYSPHGSLASLLFGQERCLEWKVRFKVAVGVAEGLRYLHHECHRRIIHRDIKASNILLTEDFEAKISDFGLAKWLPEKWAHHVVFPIEGTFGYMAPEYFIHGIINEKTDVFAYGVLLLELITGRRAVDSSRQSLVIWAKPLIDSHNVKELVDPRLGDDFDSKEMKRAMVTASMCMEHKSSERPLMTRVVQILNGVDGPAVEQQRKSKSPKYLLLEAYDLEGYTCSNYLSDLHRHRQLVME